MRSASLDPLDLPVQTSRPPDLRDRRIPLVQIAGFDRLLQGIHGPGRLVRTEHRTAPAAGAHRLDAALA